MSESPKTLKYYLEHTDEMPTDPAEIERLANEHMDAALESGEEQLTVDKIVGKADEPGSAAPKIEEDDQAKADAEKIAADTKAAEDAKAAEAGKPAEEVKPDGILAKDGKNVIPYSQLESARARAAAAENLVKQQAAELAALRSPKEKPADATDAEMLTDEELSALEADSPTLAKTIRAQQDSIRQLREAVESVTKAQQRQVESEATVVKSEIQSAIDANPMLAEWQTAEDQSMWEEASRHDRMLRESPKYANVPFAERFKKVVELTQVSLDINPEPAKEDVKLTPEAIKAAAKAKLDAANKGKRPLSLSDIPGGAPPAVDEKQKLEEMSSVAIGQQFLGMSKDQMEAYLASL